MKSLFRSLCAIILIVGALCFTGCTDPNESVEEYAMIVTAEDISQLEMFPNLKYADLRGSECYAAITAYMKAHPEVTVRYNVQIGSVDFEYSDTVLELKHYEFEYQDLMDNLQYLPAAERVVLPETTLTASQLAELSTKYPNVRFEYTVELCGTAYPSDAAEVDLSSLPASEIDNAAAKLPLLPNLATVRLCNSSGESSLTLEQVHLLRSSGTTAAFDYTTTLFGQSVSTASGSLLFDEAEIGNEGVAQIRMLLDIMSGCTSLVLDDCGIDSAVAAQLRQDYPNTEIVWRIHVGRYSMLTNEEMVYMTYDVNNTNAQELAYCTKVKYMNITHSKNLTDLSFLANMPDMEYLLLTNTGISDISVLANLTKLKYLELIYCNDVTDLTPLSGLTDLRCLNVSYTLVKDLSPLDNLPLEQFCGKMSPISQEQQDHFASKHPDCLTRYDGDKPYGTGWNYLDFGQTMSEYYKFVQNIFRYNEPGYYGNHKE